MPSFGDSIFLFVLALILFGPKKLPELARQLGKLMAEFRRASNEFRVQMEDELRVADQAERQKQIAAIEAAAPVPALSQASDSARANTIAQPTGDAAHADLSPSEIATIDAGSPFTTDSETAQSSQPTMAEHPTISSVDPLPAVTPPAAPLPIAVSGELRIMPPATGLPTGNSSLTALINSVPRSTPNEQPSESTTDRSQQTTPAAEEALHG